jgi:hypothetical protein
VTPVSDEPTPVTSAVKVRDSKRTRATSAGSTETPTGVTVTDAVALCDGSSTLVAVIVTGPPATGAVKVTVAPLPDSVPADEVHVTDASLALFTVAVNCCEPAAPTVAVAGLMLTETGSDGSVPESHTASSASPASRNDFRNMGPPLR